MNSSSTRKGVVFALLAYGAWGVFPIYWKGFGDTPAVEVVAHRLVWALLFLAVLVAVRGGGRECLAVLRSPRKLGVLALTASLLSMNWGLFIYGVNSGQVVETSLGYFINPLFNVLLGAALLRERLRPLQVVAVGLAAIGVILFGWNLWRVPWIALGLAGSFGLYGFLRKLVAVSPLPGLLVETALMTPAALGLLLWMGGRGEMHFLDSPALTWLFVGGGVVTAFPLIWFNSAAKLLPFSTLGFFQYLAPTLQLLVGVAVFREPFTHRAAVAFAFIWAAIALFVAGSRRRRSAGVEAAG